MEERITLARIHRVIRNNPSMEDLYDRIFNRLTVNRDRNFLDIEIENRFRHFTAFCMAGMPTMVAFGCYSLLTSQTLLGIITLSCFGCLCIGWYFLYRCISGIAVFRFCSLVFVSLLAYMAYVGGVDGSKILWSYIFPLIGFFLLGTVEGTVWCTLLYLTCLVLLWNPFDLTLPYHYHKDFAVRYSLSYLFITVITFIFERFRYLYRIEIEQKNRTLETEIKERQEFEKALSKSEEQYRAVFSQAAEGIMVLDTIGTLIEANPQMEHRLDMPEGDLVGYNIHDLIHPDDLARVPSQIPNMIAGDKVLLERRIQKTDGSYVLFELSGSKLTNDTILLVCRDITERKAAENALAKANKELDRQANIDGLTGIANRRRFENLLEKEWQRLKREKKPLTLILADIDYFKQFNDLYGHQEGDNCLISVAQILEGALQRPADLAARFGGEEFVVLLPNTDIEGGQHKAEQIRKMILERRISHKGSQISPYVTMSLGVASVSPCSPGIPEDLVAVADKALYKAKQNGRNRIELGESIDF